MTDYAALATVASPAVQPVSPPAAQADSFDSKSALHAERAARYRLVIEESPTGSFIYKTLDRMTGEVVKQLPREQVVSMADALDYSSGSVIDTQA